MERRSFLRNLGLAAFTDAADTGIRFFVLRSYYPRDRTEASRVQEFLSRRQALVAEHIPQFMLVHLQSPAERTKLPVALPEPPCDHSLKVVQAATNLPRLAKIIELRVYRSPTREVAYFQTYDDFRKRQQGWNGCGDSILLRIPT